MRTGSEERGVGVRRRTVDVDDVLVTGAETLGQALALQLADLGVVERHVVIRAAAEGEPVVVNGLDALSGGLLLDRRTGLVVQVDDRQHGDAIGDHLIGDGGHLGLVTVGVLDVELDAGLLESGFQVGSVLGLPPGG